MATRHMATQRVPKLGMESVASQMLRSHRVTCCLTELCIKLRRQTSPPYLIISRLFMSNCCKLGFVQAWIRSSGFKELLLISITRPHSISHRLKRFLRNSRLSPISPRSIVSSHDRVFTHRCFHLLLVMIAAWCEIAIKLVCKWRCFSQLYVAPTAAMA